MPNCPCETRAPIITDKKHNSFYWLGLPDQDARPEDFSFWDAIAAFDPENPEPLQALLRHEEISIRMDGLFVFSELGRKCVVVLDDALLSADSEDQWARNYLAEGLMSCASALTYEQAARVLPLVEDPFDRIRTTMVVCLACAPLDTLEGGIGLLDEGPGRRHAQAFEIHQALMVDPFEALEVAQTSDGLEAVYALSAIERAVRARGPIDLPAYEGDDDVIGWGLWNAQRINEWRKPRHHRRRMKSRSTQQRWPSF